jgi:hypothetical protein
MKPSTVPKPLPSPIWAWLTVALSGAAAPALAQVDAPETVTLAPVGGPILAVSLMAVGMIGAAAAGRLWIGVLLALLTGAGLILLARGLGMSALPHPFSTGLAMLIASMSFAARGTLFGRASSSRGWLIAVAVVAGEAATVLIVFALPGLLPNWFLVLLPAQWASAGIQTALTGTGTRAAGSVLIALAGTAATTLLVVVLWPRRWPYLLMFSAWLSFSALVWNWPVAPMP